MATGAKSLNTGINAMLNRTFKTSPDNLPFTRFRIGIDDTTPTNADTALGIEIPITVDTNVDACDADTGWANTGIGSAEVLNTTAGERKEGTGCLNLPTSGAAGVAAWNKTVTSFDINDTKDTLFVWFYIAAQADLTTSADAVRVTLGTGGLVNTNYYSFADTAMSDGWNILICENGGETASEGSGADETDIDTIELQVRLDVDQTTNDMRMDYYHLATASDFFASFLSGYPTFDTANRKVTIRANLGTTAANGHLLTEMGIENADATPVMISRTVHTTVSKSSKDSIIYQTIYQGTD